MKNLLFTLALIMFTWMAFSQNVLTFCPGPGLNDGTDEGGKVSGKDAFAYEGDYTTNYGSANYIGTIPISTCNQTNMQAYIRFAVDSLPADVDSVFVCFHNYGYTNYCYANCDNNFDLRYITSDWNEMTLNWESRPTSGDVISDTVRIIFPYEGGLVRMNITQAYRTWKSGSVTNFGLTIYPIDGWCNNAAILFAPSSSDEPNEALRPCLEIFTKTSSGVTDNKELIRGIGAYPNPAKENLYIKFVASRPGEYNLEFLDVLGRLIKSQKADVKSIGTNLVEVNTISFENGTYLFRLSDSQGSAMGKFMIQK